MKEYSVESAIEAARSAIHAMERIDRDINRINQHHLVPLGLETRLATEADPCSMYHHANTFNLNRQFWRKHLNQKAFLSTSQKRKLTAELGFDDRKSDWQKNLFWERLDILDRIESDRENYLKKTMASVLEQLDKYGHGGLYRAEDYSQLEFTGLHSVNTKPVTIERTQANDFLDELEMISQYAIEGECGLGLQLGTEIKSSMTIDYSNEKRLIRRNFQSDYLSVYIFPCGKFIVNIPQITAEYLYRLRGTNPEDNGPRNPPAVAESFSERNDKPEQGPTYAIKIKLGSDCGLTVEGDTKPHRETFKRHALSWYGPDLKWYVRGARGKPLTNELFVTAYELVKDLSGDGVTVSLAIEGKHVYPPVSADDGTSIIDLKPQLLTTPAREEACQAPEPEAAPKIVAKTAEEAKVIHLAPMPVEATPEPDAPKKLLEHGQPIPISELKDYDSPTEALRKLIRAKLKKACPEIRGAAMPNGHSCRVSFHARTLEPLQISVGFNQITVKQKRTVLVSSKSADPVQLYGDIENTIKAYIRENLQRIEISGDQFYARFDLDSFSISDLSDSINQPRTIPSGSQKMALIRAYNWAAEKGKKLAGLSYNELIDMLTTATGVRCHSYCAMD